MSDVYISRDKAIDAIEREFGDEALPECLTAKEAVYSVELANVAPVVHGHWQIEKVKSLHYTENVCSVCGIEYRCAYDETLDFKFCPYCGAKMGESEDEK